MLGYYSFGALLLISAAIAFWLAYFAWQRRSIPGAYTIFFLTLVTSVWSIGYAMEIWVPSLSFKVFWAKAQYLSITLVPVLLLIFTLQYTGRERLLTRLNLALLFLVPFVTLGLIWTNEWHHLIWTDIGLYPNSVNLALKLEHGAWFWVYVTYSYLLVFLASLMMLHAFLHSKGIYRRQSFVLLLGTLAPWLGNFVYLSGWDIFSHYDLTPFAFTIAGIFYTWGQLRFHFLDLVPVARGVLIENMSDAVIVLDARERIVDINPAAHKLIGAGTTRVIGLAAADVFAQQDDLFALYRGNLQTHTEICMGQGEDKRLFDLRISPIYDRHANLTARLIVLRDITERWRTEAALQKARDELETRVQERTAEIQSANLRLQQEILERKTAAKEKELLLREIHHRVKNNLQIVSSLLSLQAGDAQDLEILRDSQTRIRTMAIIHEMLYQSENLARIDFDDYIRSLANYLFSTYDASSKCIELVLEVEKIHLGIDTAIPCGLVINELISNALKHAYPDGSGGEVRITLKQDDKQCVRLKVSDRGVGFPKAVDFRQTSSLGLQLVCSLVDQVNGTIELHRNGGTVFEILFTI